MRLVFEVFSGGSIEFDLDKCRKCESKICVNTCSSQGDILKLVDGVPALKRSEDEVKRGACTECLGCELDCQMHGKNAITIILPVKYMDSL